MITAVAIIAVGVAVVVLAIVLLKQRPTEGGSASAPPAAESAVEVSSADLTFEPRPGEGGTTAVAAILGRDLEILTIAPYVSPVPLRPTIDGGPWAALLGPLLSEASRASEVWGRRARCGSRSPLTPWRSWPRASTGCYRARARR